MSDELRKGLEALRSAAATGVDNLLGKMGGELLDVSPERVSGRVPVEGNTDAAGFLHGGATTTLAESLASIAAWAQDTSKITMGIEIKVNHIRPPRSGWIVGTALPLRVGRSVSFWEIPITDEKGELVAFSTATIAIREPRTPPSSS
jgi:1,4-dihydroxy-2-naphthoyl-CoA hydrolase